MKGRVQSICRAMKLLFMIVKWCIPVIIHLSNPIKGTIPRMESNVNCGLWEIMVCQCKLIDCNKCTTVLWGVNSGEGCACVGKAYVETIFSPPFCFEPNIALKNKV